MTKLGGHVSTGDGGIILKILHKSYEFVAFPNFHVMLRRFETMGAFVIALVRMSGEINLKQRRTRASFMSRFFRNLQDAATTLGTKVTVRERWSRVFLETEKPQDLETLVRTFGIRSLSPVEHVCPPTFAAMKEQLAVYAEIVQGRTFCLRVKRVNVRENGLRSIDYERELAYVLMPFARGVALKKPDIQIEIELRPDGAYFFHRRLMGPGGLPIGVEGRALCLMSGGFDSPVAAWRIMKRGVEVDFVFFNLAGASYERSVLRVTKHLCQMWAHGYKPRIWIVDFADLSKQILQIPKKNFAQVVLKRLMYRAANEIARRNHHHALITGEAIGQVSSQTLENLAAIDESAQIPVLRPLIGMDKDEIVDLASEIGTAAMSSKIQEYCALIQKRPITATTAGMAGHQESYIDPNYLDSALENARCLDVKSLTDDAMMDQYVFVDGIPAGDVAVYDLRTPLQFQSGHVAGARLLDPDRVMKSLDAFDKNRTHIFYCAFGMQSAVLAEQLQNLGFKAFGVRGGTSALDLQPNLLN